MHFALVFNIISILILVISGFMLFPLGIAFFNGEFVYANAFLLTIFIVAAIGIIVYFVTRKLKSKHFSAKDGFLTVTISWIIASAAGALPFYISGAIPLYTNAFFETMSGFTTTGASILTEIQTLPKSILFWRSLTHWLGGMGFVVLTVAILPLLGIGGMRMVSAESPGPTIDKISPKITQMAKLLWIIYIGLTILETILLMFGGMDLFDSLTHTFGTLATGGFSPKNGSVGHYNSAYIDIVVTVFMLLAGLNFGLYYRMLIGNFTEIKKNTELKVYLLIFAAAAILAAIPLIGNVYSSFGESLRYSSFQVASVLTTTGYATANFDIWPAFSKYILFALMFIGGCSGSTGGGIKVVRIVTLFKQAITEMKQQANPRGVFSTRINGVSVKKDFVFTIVGFVFLYIMFLLITTAVVATAPGVYDLETSFSTALVTVGNIGPGFSLIGPTQNYAFFPDYVKWFLSFAMMAGRLEIYTVLILFTPYFWRRK
ncbi:MAG: TrkH family potassium uptake protein [Spirochaetales bacterium]|nr:TrkH family potassium uptake protein [Spirochaetales bacterium]